MKYNLESVNFKIHAISYIRVKVSKNMEKFFVDDDILFSNRHRIFRKFLEI